MNLAQLLECDASTLEKMTDAELLEHFKQYLDVTRPEKARASKLKPQMVQDMSPGKKRAIQALLDADPDMDLSFLKRKKKR